VPHKAHPADALVALLRELEPVAEPADA